MDKAEAARLKTEAVIQQLQLNTSFVILAWIVVIGLVLLAIVINYRQSELRKAIGQPLRDSKGDFWMRTIAVFMIMGGLSWGSYLALVSPTWTLK